VRCPECASPHLQVVDSRDTPDGVRRRRVCAQGHRFTTYERRELFHCPACGATESRIDSASIEPSGVHRRRQCAACNAYYDTREGVLRQTPTVVKLDGRHEAFNRGKLFASLRTATSKRGIATETLEAAVDGIEAALENTGRPEVDTRAISRMAMGRLLLLDDVAYVRYASNYLGAGDIDDMLEVIREARARRERESIRQTHQPLVPDEADLAR